ncbi:putative MPP superfamily phosphohydrolase [Kineococcus radiotolerans]|uniref:Putative MPP superfamily phosphohydrolase n=1 Tax=Kineococcus radiotolerans TaxID=131568 RepID=A0A7W4XX77_KINRA|nr:metallophosphoesterase [Kineococcus radiotolerans]MBB2900934.1 putative MPP superfamily phosphohydrolase [Kineococcus radiotolerans]
MAASSRVLRAVAGTAGAAALAGAAGVGYAAGYEVRAFALRHALVPVLPVGAAPLRVLHLSDLHLVPRQHRKRAWVAALADLEPDLVVVTGDNLAAHDAVPAVLETYAGLLTRPGVFVLGSNDYWAPRPRNWSKYLLGPSSHAVGEEAVPLPTADLVRGFTDAGWVDLDNARARLGVGALDVEFVGVDDPHLGYDRYDDVARPAAPDADLTIAVTHAPYRRTLDAMTADGAALLVAGHTHGGQLCVPGYGALVTNCDLPREQVSGLSRWSAGGHDAWLHVSAGLGTSPYAPLRFACRPEATLLELVPRR